MKKWICKNLSREGVKLKQFFKNLTWKNISKPEKGRKIINWLADAPFAFCANQENIFLLFFWFISTCCCSFSFHFNLFLIAYAFLGGEEQLFTLLSEWSSKLQLFFQSFAARIIFHSFIPPWLWLTRNFCRSTWMNFWWGD